MRTSSCLVATAVLATLLSGCSLDTPQPGQPGQPGVSSWSQSLDTTTSTGGTAGTGSAPSCIVLTFSGPATGLAGQATLTWTPLPGGADRAGLTVERSDGKPTLATAGPPPLTIDLGRLGSLNGTASAPLVVRVAAAPDSGVAPHVSQTADLKVALAGHGAVPTVTAQAC